jgi:hypothetical protein
MTAAAFASANDAIFAAFGVTAVYRPAAVTGSGTPVVVVRESPTADAAAFGVAVRAGAQMLHVRISEVAALGKGDTFTIGAEVLTVQGAPARDGQASMWTVEC